MSIETGIFFSKDNIIKIFNIFTEFLVNKKNINKNSLEYQKTREFIYNNMLLYVKNNENLPLKEELDFNQLKNINIKFINKLIDNYFIDTIVIDSKNRNIIKYPSRYEYIINNNIYYNGTFNVKNVILNTNCKYCTLIINNESILLIANSSLDDNFTIFTPVNYKNIIIDETGDINIKFILENDINNINDDIDYSLIKNINNEYITLENEIELYEKNWITVKSINDNMFYFNKNYKIKKIQGNNIYFNNNINKEQKYYLLDNIKQNIIVLTKSIVI